VAGQIVVKASRVSTVSQPTGQRFKVGGVERRRGQIAGIATYHSQGINQPAQKVVGVGQSSVIDSGQHADAQQGVERCARVGCPKFGMLRTAIDLQRLHEVFEIDQTAGTEFRVELGCADKLMQLTFTHRANGGEIDGLSGVEQLVAQSRQFAAELHVAGNGSQLHERLSFIGPRRSVGLKVTAERIERDGQTSRTAVGSQPQIDPENSFAAGADRMTDVFDQAREEARVGNRLASVCRRFFGGRSLGLRHPVGGVHEHQFNVRRKAQLASTAFAESTDRQRARSPVVRLRNAKSLHQLGTAELNSRRDDDLGQVGHLVAEGLDASAVSQNVSHVDAEEFSILELIQLIPSFVGRGG